MDMNVLIWAQYFSVITGWQYHPGNKDRLPVEMCALIADRMYELTVERERLWHSSQV